MQSSHEPKDRTPVLVVGAGPVGLVAAICLREQGVNVRIVDEQSEASKRSYPVIVHARTLRLLGRLGVTAPLEWRGRFVSKLSVHTEGALRAELQLPSAEPVAPGALTLPQDVLRRALVLRLSTLGVEIEWQTRLVALEQDAAQVRVALVRRERAESSGPSPGSEWLDVATQTFDTDFVVGADGRRSTVRRALRIEMQAHGRRELYAFFDAPDARAGAEAHLVFSEGYGSTVYPLHGDWSRFSFELGAAAPQAPGVEQLRELLAARLPWYGQAVDGFEWSGSAEFHPAVAQRFGENRAWLAGDAAHVTGPLGGQSINVGMHEADELARHLASALQTSEANLGRDYGEQRRIEWSRLFGLQPSQPDVSKSPAWVRQHVRSLIPSLPAAGDDLDDLLEQLKISTA
jgi:2-polyprenyl-6-methoxyphenol hydroxylase-like FAD-dependent oxidoreductase